MENLETLLQKSREKKANDEFVGAVYKKNGEICIRSGAGIVADSVPEKEFQECCNKARAVVQAIEQAQEGLE